jgi:hypothetical protein
MAEDVWKCGIYMAFELYFRKYCGGSIGCGGQGLHCFATAGNYFFGIAFEEDFTDKFCFALRFGVGKVPGTVESFAEGEVLFCYDSAGYPLRSSISWCR